jgi:hypothetical protein
MSKTPGPVDPVPRERLPDAGQVGLRNGYGYYPDPLPPVLRVCIEVCCVTGYGISSI